MNSRRSVKIGRRTVPIVDNAALHPRYHGITYHGGDADRIELNPRLGRDKRGRALLHEVIHYVALSRGVRLRERDVLRLEAGLMSFLRKNPRHVRDICRP